MSAPCRTRISFETLPIIETFEFFDNVVISIYGHYDMEEGAIWGRSEGRRDGYDSFEAILLVSGSMGALAFFFSFAALISAGSL